MKVFFDNSMEHLLLKQSLLSVLGEPTFKKKKKIMAVSRKFPKEGQMFKVFPAGGTVVRKKSDRASAYVCNKKNVFILDILRRHLF